MTDDETPTKPTLVESSTATHPKGFKEYDLFISHASEDKDSIVRRVAEYLRSNGYKIWYDEFTLRVGDSLRASIDLGLLRSRFGIVVLSKSFIAKKWPNYEIDGLFSIEMSGKAKIILPIWHDVTREDVMNFSPTLADRMAIKSDMTDGEIMQTLAKVIGPPVDPRLRFRRVWINDLGKTFSDCPRCGYAVSFEWVGSHGDYHITERCFGCGWGRSDWDYERINHYNRWNKPD